MTEFDENFYRELLDHLHEGIYFVDRERRITFWNKGAEQITGFSRTEVLGKRCFDNLLRHVNDGGVALCEGSCPLQQTLEDGRARTATAYLHHKDGHRLPVAIEVSPLADYRQNIIGAVEVFRDNSATLSSLEHIRQLEDLAYLDRLTHIANRTYLENFIEAKFNEFRRMGWAFGLIFLDVDNFKQINDTYGHQAGDLALKMLAQILSTNFRSFDLAGRWGGEEFICVLCNLEDRGQLQAAAERVRTLVESSWVDLENQVLRVTISLGATMARPDDTLETLVQRADHLMYQSKLRGRNCTTYG